MPATDVLQEAVCICMLYLFRAHSLHIILMLHGDATELEILCTCRCWHYGGGDPIEAEQVVREMCGTSGMEPDGTTARWLAAIDISWQQLHCGF